jgi:type VI protein secretion system component Hcp
MKTTFIACTLLFTFLSKTYNLNAQNIGIGTTTPQSKLHILNSQAGDGGLSQSLLIENNATGSGEAGVLFKNTGSTGTGAKGWFMGLNQTRNMSWAYGNSFLFSLTKMTLDSTGSLGIGTLDPNNSAILDVTSTDKGILLPRLADTSNVTAPAAGLVIYNQNTKTPNFFDGTKWNDLNGAGRAAPLVGNITYTVTGTTVGGLAYETGVLSAFDYSGISFTPKPSVVGGGSSKPRNVDSVVILKEFDGNSLPFMRASIGGNTIAEIEIKHFLPNDVNPFFSIKLTTVYVTSQSYFISETTGRRTERLVLQPNKIGFKDWANNKSFSYDLPTLSFGVY